MHRVLNDTPEPFASNTILKHAALAHFEAKVSLASSSSERAARRPFNDSILESKRPVHSMFDQFVPEIEDEIQIMLSNADAGGSLDWATFDKAWYRLVRRIILGKSARDDDRLTDMLARLRSAANWVFLFPRRKRLEQQFHHRLEYYLAKAEAGSLAERIPSTQSHDAAPTHQVAHWLFASDAAGINIFRTLALIATHPDIAERARKEIAAAEQANHLDLPFLRACVLDSVRLWPTTPMILRETAREVAWPNGAMPKGTQVLIYTPFFHRDDERLSEAHRFAPDVWLDPDPARRYPFVPFSDGPAICPAHNFVPELSSLVIAAILKRRHPRINDRHGLDPKLHLPGTLNPFTLRFSLKASPIAECTIF
jgi:hypothetical protein